MRGQLGPGIGTICDLVHLDSGGARGPEGRGAVDRRVDGFNVQLRGRPRAPVRGTLRFNVRDVERNPPPHNTHTHTIRSNVVVVPRKSERLGVIGLAREEIKLHSQKDDKPRVNGQTEEVNGDWEIIPTGEWTTVPCFRSRAPLLMIWWLDPFPSRWH